MNSTPNTDSFPSPEDRKARLAKGLTAVPEVPIAQTQPIPSTEQAAVAARTERSPIRLTRRGRIVRNVGATLLAVSAAVGAANVTGADEAISKYLGMNQDMVPSQAESQAAYAKCNGGALDGAVILKGVNIRKSPEISNIDPTTGNPGNIYESKIGKEIVVIRPKYVNPASSMICFKFPETGEVGFVDFDTVQNQKDTTEVIPYDTPGANTVGMIPQDVLDKPDYAFNTSVGVATVVSSDQTAQVIVDNFRPRVLE